MAEFVDCVAKAEVILIFGCRLTVTLSLNDCFWSHTSNTKTN